MGEKEQKEYATIQIRKHIKDQIVEYCNLKGMKIGRYIENLFISNVSGSAGP